MGEKTLMRVNFKVIKHALGSFGEQDGYDKRRENDIAKVRMFIVGSNLLCAWIIIFNIVMGWFS